MDCVEFSIDSQETNANIEIEKTLKLDAKYNKSKYDMEWMDFFYLCSFQINVYHITILRLQINVYLNT